MVMRLELKTRHDDDHRPLKEGGVRSELQIRLQVTQAAPVLEDLRHLLTHLHHRASAAPHQVCLRAWRRTRTKGGLLLCRSFWRSSEVPQPLNPKPDRDASPPPFRG